MIRRISIAILALVAAGCLGWLLAETEPVASRFNGSEALALPPASQDSDAAGISQSLELLYQRSAWSAVSPEPAEPENNEEEDLALPEGLDRFRLLGILRVSGVAPEVLLKDLNADQGQQTVFRATEGDNLQNSGVVLALIGRQKISLEQAGEAKALFLFPRSPTNGRDE